MELIYLFVGCVVSVLVYIDGEVVYLEFVIFYIIMF